MGNKKSTPVILTPPARATQNTQYSFVHADLVAHVKAIQQQIIEIEKILANRWKTDKKIEDQLKSRSLIFIEPNGNRIINKYMDHELISKVITTYKKNYIPKYLQQWLRIGIMNQNNISLLYDWNLKSTVSKYDDGHEFITYGEVIVWVEYYENWSFKKVVLRVLPTDNVDKIKIQIKDFQKFPGIELRLATINQNTEPNKMDWEKGTILHLEDSIMSCKLHQANSVIMAKFTKEKVNYHFFHHEF